MKRIGMTAVVALCLMALAWMADRPAAAQGAMAADPNIKMEDCSAMFRSVLPLPTKFAELMSAVADGTEAHATWVGSSKDKAGQAEAATLKKVAKSQREVAALMKKIATDMEAGGKLAPAPHDMSKAPANMGEMMKKSATLEREMAALMVKHADETDAMLMEMAKGAPGAQ